MSKPAANETSDIIAACLTILHARIRSAEHSAAEATFAMAYGNRNRAIGFLVDLERILPQCDALYRTVVLFHHSGESASTEGGAA